MMYYAAIVPVNTRHEGLIMSVTEGDIEGKCLPGRQRTVQIDDVR